MKTLLLILLTLSKTTLGESEPEPLKQCYLPRKTGSCRLSIRRFYWDEAAGECKLFIYGGCKGNENNFETEQDCLRACGPASANVIDYYEPVPNHKSKIPRFYWDSTTGQCQKFNFGGCQGKQNRFYSKHECRNACEPSWNDEDNNMIEVFL